MNISAPKRPLHVSMSPKLSADLDRILNYLQTRAEHAWGPDEKAAALEVTRPNGVTITITFPKGDAPPSPPNAA